VPCKQERLRALWQYGERYRPHDINQRNLAGGISLYTESLARSANPISVEQASRAGYLNHHFIRAIEDVAKNGWRGMRRVSIRRCGRGRRLPSGKRVDVNRARSPGR